MLFYDSNDVLLQSYMDIMRPSIASRASIRTYLIIFHYPYPSRVSTGSSRVIIQDCRTYIQNIIDYTIKVNCVARNNT